MTDARVARGASLRTRVPLYLCAGLFAVIAAWTWISYSNVRDASITVGQQHLQGVASQFVTSYQTNARDVARGMRTVAGNKAIVDFVRRGGAAERTAALAVMRRVLTTGNHRVELFAPDGTPLLNVPDSATTATLERHEELADEFAAAAKGPDFATVAPLRILDDSVVVPVVAAVLVDSQLAGYAVVWRRLVSPPQLREALAKLIGADARLYLGNARGDLWSNLGGTRHRFPVPLTLDGTVARYERNDSVRVMSAARAVEGTPWAVAIEFADSAVMAPASQFLSQSVIVGFVLLLLATGTAWLLSRRITTPLHELTEAATALAAGDYSRRVRIDRQDEIGVLSAAYNVMVDRVSESHHTMETRIDQRTAQLNERNEDLEAFSHSVSHDLRAPLRAMHGFSQALLDDHAGQLDDTGRDYARRIAVAAKRMDLLTQDLLAYSRVGRGDTVLAPVDLGAVVRDALAQLEGDIAARQARVTVHEPLPAVVGHRATLEQSFANLASNAIKFVADGIMPAVDIRASVSRGRVRVWVEDNGIGIAPPHHQRIFNVFERLHDTERYSGTGIGLAIVRKAIERMGGTVGVESRAGAGSRFWIELQSAEA